MRKFWIYRKSHYLCIRILSNVGTIAQSVEQRTENPCVPGSIPGGTTQMANVDQLLIFCEDQEFSFDKS